MRHGRGSGCAIFLKTFVKQQPQKCFRNKMRNKSLQHRIAPPAVFLNRTHFALLCIRILQHQTTPQIVHPNNATSSWTSQILQNRKHVLLPRKKHDFQHLLLHFSMFSKTTFFVNTCHIKLPPKAPLRKKNSVSPCFASLCCTESQPQFVRK